MDRRWAVVSGGGTGIGRAVARTLAADGTGVVILGRREEVLRRAADELNSGAGTGPVHPVVADLRDPAGVERAAGHIARLAPAVDVLVNNAGCNVAPSPHTDLAGVRADWEANLSGNILPVVLLTQALLDRLRRPGGRVVTITSVAAFRGPASYGGAKAALHVWSAELAAALAPERITVNAIAPGYVEDTEFYGERMNPEFHRGRAAQARTGRATTPQEIAGLVRYLAGAEAGQITGQVLHVNGGALLGRQ
ncbi:SDR family NAD(P)-dependent oxidoreductase [Streptomyces griseoincarnatus]